MMMPVPVDGGSVGPSDRTVRLPVRPGTREVPGDHDKFAGLVSNHCPGARAHRFLLPGRRDRSGCPSVSVVAGPVQGESGFGPEPEVVGFGR